jgi:hypothetical protein
MLGTSPEPVIRYNAFMHNDKEPLDLKSLCSTVSCVARRFDHKSTHYKSDTFENRLVHDSPYSTRPLVFDTESTSAVPSSPGICKYTPTGFTGTIACRKPGDTYLPKH